MKIRKSLLTIFLLLFCSASLLFSAHAAQQKPIKLKYSTFFASTDKQAQLGGAWAREIEKRTLGKVTIGYIPDGAFLKGGQICEGVLFGATDIGMSAFSYGGCLFPVMDAIDLPLGYPNAKVATSVINNFYETFRPQELAGIKVLYLHAHGPGLLHSRLPVYKLEDLWGMRIRSTSTSAKITNALGAAAVIRSQGYTYVLLQDHYVDATWSPMEVLKAWNQAEVIRYTIESYCIGYTSGFYVAMNLKKWNSLPKDVQRVFEEVSAEWISKHAEAWDSSDEEGREFTLSLGNKIISLSQEECVRWGKAAQSVIDEYVTQVGSKGLAGKGYVEAIRDLIKKYK